MITAWTKHLKDPEDKKKFEDSLLHTRWLLDHLKKLIEEDLTGLDRSETDIRTFDQPNWAYRQAFKNGCRMSYNRILTLINLDQKDIK